VVLDLLNNKNLANKLLGISLLFFVFSCFSFPGNIFSKDSIKVALLESADVPQYKRAVDGFLAGLSSKRIESDRYLMSSSAFDSREFVSDINKNNVDLVLAVGTEAAILCKQNVKNVSVVFCMVGDPAGQGLNRISNISGVSLDISYTDTLEAILKVVPQAKTVGILYNPEHNEKNINNIKTQAFPLGLDILSEKVYGRSDLIGAFGKVVDKVDVMWVITDPIISNAYSIKYILSNTLQKSIPVVGISSQYVKAGALFALTPDYYDIGRQASEQATSIVDEGITSLSLGVVGPRKNSLVINMRTANAINLDIDSAIIRQAEEVFK